MANPGSVAGDPGIAIAELPRAMGVLAGGGSTAIGCSTGGPSADAAKTRAGLGTSNAGSATIGSLVRSTPENVQRAPSGPDSCTIPSMCNSMPSACCRPCAPAEQRAVSHATPTPGSGKPPRGTSCTTRAVTCTSGPCSPSGHRCTSTRLPIAGAVLQARNPPPAPVFTSVTSCRTMPAHAVVGSKVGTRACLRRSFIMGFLLPNQELAHHDTSLRSAARSHCHHRSVPHPSATGNAPRPHSCPGPSLDRAEVSALDSESSARRHPASPPPCPKPARPQPARCAPTTPRIHPLASC